MLKLLLSALRRIMTAVTNPFRMLIVRVQRMFNINVITAKLVRPLTKKVKALITLRPQSREDYLVIGRWWIYKKLFLSILLALCAGVFIYFTMFAPKLPATQAVASIVQTNLYFDFDDMDLRDFTGVANIRAADGQVVFTGDIERGACTGNGSLWDRKGKLEYQGGFENNQFSGFGSYFYPDGKKKYEGIWSQNAYHGEGILYAQDGATQIYNGQFANGLYEGQGKAWSAEGVLLYEGDFSKGLYHGQGTRYYPDGTTQYKGDFLNGLPQGKGELYSKTGKLLYTGDVYQGQINYRALTGCNFSEIRGAFSEAPRVFYTDTDSAFLFEQAGVVVTVDCRVRVDTWERPADEREQPFYYMPGEYGTAPLSTSVYFQKAPARENLPPQMVRTKSANQRQSPVVSTCPLLSFDAPDGFPARVHPISWYVAGDEKGDYAASSGAESAPASNPESGSPDGGSLTYSGDGDTEMPRGQGNVSSPEASSSQPAQDRNPYPEFVEKDQKLYFEIDQNVWQSEDELDAAKVRVKRVTAFAGQITDPPEDAVEYRDDSPVGLDDCVAIDLLRAQLPTAFPQIRFEADRQNRLFVRLWNLDFTSRIERRAYLSGELTYRYTYQNPEDEKPLYFSVER